MSIPQKIAEYWDVLAGVGTTIAGVLGWLSVRKKKKDDSTQMLYDQLEALKKKVILQVATEVAQATEIGERDKIIEGLKRHCPECYDRFIENQES